MKRFVSFLLLVFLLFSLTLPLGYAEKAAIPDVLRFSQKIGQAQYVRDQQYIQRTYPNTANPQVNKAMTALIDGMADTARPFLPKGRIELMPSYLDVGATIFRTGAQWMSFLTIARIAYEREQVYVDFDARVYDMVSGDRLALTDLFAPDSPAWDLMAQEVRAQLSDYFITEAPDAQALEALCQREALENAAFTLTPGKIELHYRADALYSGKNTLLHVRLYYSAWRPLMTERGQEITDNSNYKMLALTYDDGGARGASNNVLNKLRQFGANATFFIIGEQMSKNHDVMSRQQDAGYAMASHNYSHEYELLTPDRILPWKDQFDREMDAIIGVRPAYMRAPGGHFQVFIDSGVGLPLIQWSNNSSDAGNDNEGQVVDNVMRNAKDGDVVLLHDLNPIAYRYTETILQRLEAKNILCVTLDELYDHFGQTLEPNQVYYGCADIAKGLQ